MKKQLLFISLISISSLLFSCGSKDNNNDKPKEDDDKPIVIPPIDPDYEEEELDNSTDYVLPSAVVVPDNDIHTPTQYAYIMSGYNTISRFGNGSQELSKSRALRFLVGNREENYDKYYIEVSESSKFKGEVFNFETTANYVDVKNLKIGTTYYFRGSETKENLKDAQIKFLRTADTAPRNLDIDGITNVRDLGGYRSQLGGKVRQGLYYRGGRFNVSETNTYKADLTEAGYEQLVYDIGLRSEIDLRMNNTDGIGSIPNEFGYIDNDSWPDIEYNNFPFDWTQSNMMLQSKDQIAKVFHLLADPEAYPVYLHCNIGTDRTGLCSYLLGCLLGIPQTDLYRDYLYSNLGHINNTRDISAISSKYRPTLEAYEQENMHKNARAYLIDIGLEEEEIDSIVDIFVDTTK